jgi:hypothetical protein
VGYYVLGIWYIINQCVCSIYIKVNIAEGVDQKQLLSHYEFRKEIALNWLDSSYEPRTHQIKDAPSNKTTGLTGFRLWRQYWRQLLGSLFKGAFLPQNGTFCPLFSHDTSSFEVHVLSYQLKSTPEWFVCVQRTA